jgi:hypothetical protein
LMRRTEQLLATLSSLAIAGAATLAVVHAGDRYRIDVASGARIALAQYATHGEIYPELHNDGFYGGTRFMPLPIVLHRWVSAATGEYLTSGKLLSYVTMVALLIAMMLLLKRMGCPPAIVVGSAALVLVTRTGLGALMSLRSDSLPLLLQVASIGLISSPRRSWTTPSASALAALALVAKLSAVWAALAAFLWLLLRDKRRAVNFAASYFLLAGALLWIFGTATGGRIYENVFGLAGAGIDASSVVRAPYRLVQLGVAEATSAWLLLPLAAAGTLLTLRGRRPSIYALALICALAVLVAVLTDIGTGWNQLIDLAVLVPLALGSTIRWGGEAGGRTVVAAAMAGAIMLGSATTLMPELLQTVSLFGGEETYEVRPLSSRATHSTTLLSEDPYIPVSVGQTPVVLDPFILLRIGRDNPGAVDELIARIRDQEFDLVVLVVALSPPQQTWWRDYHFGTDVAVAIDESYVYAGRMQGYHLYEPRSR